MAKKKLKTMKRRGTADVKQRTNSGGTIPYKPPHGGRLLQFAPGHTGNPNGRPRKFVSKLGKQFGYSNQEIIDTMKALIGMSEDELLNIEEDTEATALERIVAKAMGNAMDKGELNPLETIITRAFGSPRQILEQKVEAALTDNRIDLKKLDIETLRKLKAARTK